METKRDTDDLIIHIKKASFDVACIFIIFVMFASMSRHFKPSLPPLNYERIFAYFIFLVISTVALRCFKSSLAQLFVNALCIGFAATIAGEINKER